jgi:hypothetical protein
VGLNGERAGRIMARGRVTQAVNGDRRMFRAGWVAVRAVISYVAAVFSSWQLYACATTGILSTWLLENSYQAGPLAAAPRHRIAD